ncbi:MAG TPA: hypothetical protein VKV15_28400 [Bryobacteraceae bacterium]|nr:hypothetical protein [Bryobacteraceae bacterium]
MRIAPQFHLLHGFLAASIVGWLFGVPTLPAQNPADLPAQVGPTKSAPPFSISKKFDYRVVQTFGLRGFVGSAFGSAIGQARDVPYEWGEGVGGYATRYAASFGTNLSHQTMEFTLESVLHEDPRYFPSKEKGFKARMKNVLLQTLVARKDSGGNQFAYARIASAFGTGQLVNVWQPNSTGSVGGGIERGFIILGADTFYNFLQEFFPFVRPRALRK